MFSYHKIAQTSAQPFFPNESLIFDKTCSEKVLVLILWNLTRCCTSTFIISEDPIAINK